MGFQLPFPQTGDRQISEPSTVLIMSYREKSFCQPIIPHALLDQDESATIDGAEREWISN